MSFQAYMTIEGSQQRKFRGDSNLPGHAWEIKVLAFDVPVTSPRDIASGQASGKRTYQPVKIVKEWGASSPQLFTALTSNEILTSVNIRFTESGANGKGQTQQTIKLTNASVVGIRRFSVPPSGKAQSNTHEHEEVSFTFQEIELENKTGNAGASDDWTNSSNGTSSSRRSGFPVLSRAVTIIRWPR